MFFVFDTCLYSLGSFLLFFTKKGDKKQRQIRFVKNNIIIKCEISLVVRTPILHVGGSSSILLSRIWPVLYTFFFASFLSLPFFFNKKNGEGGKKNKKKKEKTADDIYYLALIVKKKSIIKAHVFRARRCSEVLLILRSLVRLQLETLIKK